MVAELLIPPISPSLHQVTPSKRMVLQRQPQSHPPGLVKALSQEQQLQPVGQVQEQLLQLQWLLQHP
jgi:hypothetical protein